MMMLQMQQHLHSTLVLLKIAMMGGLRKGEVLFTFYFSSIKEGEEIKANIQPAGFTFYFSSIKAAMYAFCPSVMVIYILL